MKAATRRIHSFIPALLLILVLSSCSDSGHSGDTSVTEMTLRQTASGTISSVGEVDWYHYRANEANSVLEVKCASNTYRPDVDLLVTVYELDAEGHKNRLYADHAPEGSQMPADVKMYIYIDTPKDIYVSVRDLLDDESSDNSYYLCLDFAQSAEGNESFAQATTLIVDNDESCQIDSISSIGDVDCFKFEAPEDGVYEVRVDFAPFQGGTDVKLTVDIYDSEGILVESLTRGQADQYYIRPYLRSGEYYVLVDESGRDDFDTASTYQICINSIAVSELHQNDTADNAATLAFANPIEISGSLDYWDDKDWYQFPLSSGTGLKIVKVAFSVENINFDYQINIEDSGQNLLLTHSHSGGSSVYQTQIRAGEGDEHYLMIEAAEGETISQPASYSVSIEVTEVNDADDVADIGNSPNTAVQLTTDTPPDPTNPTYIGYRGDEDWYMITVPPVSPAESQVLEVFLDDPGESSVEYYLSILLDGIVVNKTYDTNGGDGATHLKMSMLVPESENEVTYYFLVRDYQGDEGDSEFPYTIYANFRQFPSEKADLPDDSLRDDPDTRYYGEAGELDETGTIILQHSSVRETEYKVNNSWMDFRSAPLSDGVTVRSDTPETGQTTINFPWIAGHIDYQSDMDFFQVNLGPLNDDTEWYYDIRVEMHVGNPGSQVEYTWEFYRDSNQDQILVDRPSSSSCIFACNGDTTPTVVEPIEITTPAGNQEFWVGDGWADRSPLFYIGIRDFDYVDESPDDDWGYDVPYYIRLTLIYHSGQSYAGEGE